MLTTPDLATTLVYLGAVLVAVGLASILTTITLGRARRWGAVCTRCAWRRRDSHRPRLEEAARAHAASSGHGTVNIYRRGAIR